jgi:hypothetical protein
MQNSIPLAGKTVVLSFYARAGANYSAASSVLRATIEYQTSGSESNYWFIGDGAGDVIAVTTNAALTTSWVRYTATVTLPSTVTQIFTAFKFTPVGTAGANDYFEVTGVQLELGSTATTFSRAGGGGIQGELAACQRYYQRVTSASTFYRLASGLASTTSKAEFVFVNKVSLRTVPTSLDYSNPLVTDGNSNFTGGTLAFNYTSGEVIGLDYVHGSSTLTQFRPMFLFTNGASASAFIGFSAEL